MGVLHLLKRSVGIGDVLMLLPLARALKTRDRAEVVIATDPQIAQTLGGPAIPGLDALIDIAAAEDFAAARAAAGDRVQVHDMNHPRHSLQQGHQIDSFLAALGFDPGGCDRAIRLPPVESAAAMAEFYLDEVPERSACRGRVLLHPASGAVNRTWPQARWQALADRLRAAGVQVFLIGNRSAATGKGAFALAGEPVYDLVDKFGFWETVALMTMADCLVSTDSAPVQMAGATEIAIVGLYSITRGDWRLPLRPGGRAIAVEPSCRFFPCYPLMYDAEHLQTAQNHFDSAGISRQNLLYEWCCDDYSYACLNEQIGIDRVFQAVMSTLPAPAAP